MAREYYMYIAANVSRTLYIGVTNDLLRRMWEHKTKFVEGFTARYNIGMLVDFESTTDVTAAIAREKQLKGWRRDRKVALIEAMNPRWLDLSDEWFDHESLQEESAKNSQDRSGK